MGRLENNHVAFIVFIKKYEEMVLTVRQMIIILRERERETNKKKEREQEEIIGQ